MYDLILKNGLVADGSRAKPYRRTSVFKMAALPRSPVRRTRRQKESWM